MKRILSIALAMLLLVTVFVACDQQPGGAETTADDAQKTEAPTAAPTAEPTDEPTEEPTAEPTEEPTEDNGEEPTLPADDVTGEGEGEGEGDDLPYEVIDLPNAYSGELQLQGYITHGNFAFDEGEAISDDSLNMFIVTNDTMTAGRLTATFTAPAGDNNDNGIVFGMEDDTWEQYYFWEDGPAYYILFVSDIGTLYLAKASVYGAPWTELLVTDLIPNYTHGDTITIAAEFDGQGNIDCYANGELMISVYDSSFLYGCHYGIRCEVPGVVYHSLIAEHD